MANKIGDFYWEIDADTSKFNKGAQGTEKQIGKLGKSFTGLGKLISVAFVATAVTGIAKVSKQLILAASDAEETQNKFSVTFSSIQRDAEATAQNLADNFGLSSNAAKTLLSDTGDLLTGFGFTQEAALDLSDQVNQLAVDLASFTNFSGGAAGASQALTKALLGERESVKALGISILETDVQAKVLELTQQGLTFETERQAKAQATLAIALEQSKNAIGDFARSQDSFANQSRIAKAAVDDLKVELGQGLLPIATSIVSIFGDATTAFKDYVAELNQYNRESKAAETLTGAIEDQIAGLVEKNRLLSQSLKDSRLDWMGQGFSEEQIAINEKYYNDQIVANQNIIDGLRLEQRIKRAIEEQDNKAAQAAADEALKEEARLAAQQEYIKFVEGEYSATNQAKLEELRREVALIEQNIDGYGGLREEQLLLIALKNEEIAQLEEELGLRDVILGDIEEKTLERMRLERMTADAVAERAEREKQYLEELAEFEAETLRLRAEGYAGFFGAVSELIGAFGSQALGLAVAQKAFASAEAGINSYLAYTQVLADPSFIGRPFARGINAAAVLASGLAQQVKIISTPIPSFETGGIVPGTSYTGDNVAANVNSGEMILNRAQQAQLFDIANGAGIGGPMSVYLKLPDNTSVKWVVDAINAGRGGVIQGRVVK